MIGLVARRFLRLSTPAVTAIVTLVLAGCGGPAEDVNATRPRMTGPTPQELVLSTSLGDAATASVQLANVGDARLSYRVAELPAWLRGDALTGTVAPGASVTVRLTAACDAGQEARDATLSVYSNDPDRSEVALPVALTCEAPRDASPTASFTAEPRQGTAPLDVALDATASTDPDGEIVSYAWDLGDGDEAEGATLTHRYEAPGSYVVTLRVRDDDGLEATHQETVRAAAPDAEAPTADIDASPASGTAQPSVTVTFEGSAHDPDGTVTGFAWTIDGIGAEGPVVEHTFDAAGTYLVELVVTDDDGLSTLVSEAYEVLASLYAVPDAVAFDLGASPPGLRVSSTGEWTLASDAGWLDAGPAFGGAGWTDVALDVVSGDGLSGAEATATLTLEGDGGERVEVPVTLRLPDVGGVEGVPVELVATTGNAATGGFTVENDGRAPLAVSADSDQDWIDVTPGSDAAAPGGSASFDVTAQCGAVEETREGVVALTFDDPDEPSATVDVTIACHEPTGTSAYQIELIYYGDDPPSASQRQVFEQAAARWSEVITGDLPDVTLPEGSTPCGLDRPTYGGTIDDLVVFVGLFDMDGPGGILGQAGPCWMRSGSELPFAGMVELDIADVDDLEADGLLEDTAMHELGHVLGIGTLWVWGSRDLVDPDCPSTQPESRFVGAEATDAHEQVGGSGSPYVESDGGQGTRCGHWDEDRYGHELMTGFLNRGEALSRFTIGSLADIGYEVDYGAADAYTVGSLRQGAEVGVELRDLLVDPSMFEQR